MCSSAFPQILLWFFMYEREVYRMSYVCVSINKEVVNKETFTNKQQAVAYFQKLHGEKIREEKEGLKIRLRNSIRNYDNRIHRELSAYEKREVPSEKIQQDFYKAWKEQMKTLQEKKEKKEAELEQLCRSMDEVEGVYEAKYNGYKNNLFTQEPQLILHISGIYQNGYQFTVMEEKYYYIGAKIDTDKSIHSVFKKLPSQFDKNRISLYIFKELDDCEEKVELDNLDKVQKTVSRIRNQILRNFQNDPSRLKLA